jgi:hypothetical protein
MSIYLKNFLQKETILEKFNNCVLLQTNENYISAFYFVPELMNEKENLKTHELSEYSLKTHELCEYSPELKSTLKEILSLAKSLLESHNYEIDESDYYIEFWSYKLKGNEGTIPMPLIRHKDDEAAVMFKVETCIFYTEKSDTIKGGNLMLFDNENQLSQIIKINAGDVVLLRGDITHQVEQVSGKGIRNCIVVQYKSKRNKNK